MKVRPETMSSYRSNWRYMSLAALLLAGLLAVVWASAQGAGAAPLKSEVQEAKDSDRGGRSIAASTDSSAVVSPTCSPNWTAITTPNAAFQASLFTTVAEVGPNDVWAAGTYQANSSSSEYLPLFEHWDGTSWALVAAPLPAPGAQGEIWALSVSSANDIWAVGIYTAGSNTNELIYRWNGLQWDVVAGAQPSTTDNELMGVAAVSTNNVWAAGSYTEAGLKKTLIEHWNGSTWTHVGSPDQGTGDNSLQDISVVPGSSGNDMWAVGNYEATPGSPNKTLTMRYNGALWSYVASPNQGMSSNKLMGIAAIATNDAWATGSYQAGSVQHTLAEHWNGSAWSASPTIDPGPQGNNFVRVFATAGNDVWAVGETASGLTAVSTLIEHWNGTSWSVEPNTAAGAASFAFDIDGASTGDIWVVGFYAPSQASPTSEVLVEHYNGTGWGQVNAPNPPTSADLLMSVSAVSAGDIWAVGGAQGYISGNLTSQGLIEHWNGTTWSVVPSAHPTTYGERLASVKALSANDVWAVGYFSNATNEQTFVEHWNGTTWSQIASPNPGGSNRNNDLTGVDAASSNDAWAVGYYNNGTKYQTLILHWDGTTWLQFTSPNPGAFSNYLYDVTVVPGSGGNDVWAVGYYLSTAGGHFSSLLERWNGSAWSVVASPNVPGVDTEPLSIFALSANDVWVVGYTVSSTPPTQNLAMHWNGTSWSIVSAAQQGPYDNQLSDVTGTASNDVYAIGAYTNASTQDHGLIEHWNGSAWSVVSSVQVPGIGSLLSGVTAVSSTDVWAVGEWLQAGFGDYQPLAMRYHPCPVSCTITFSDVPAGSTFYPYIHCLACLGIINGYPDGTFKPNANVTRGQLSKIVSNSAGFNDTQPNQMFQDVPVGSTFQVFIGRLASRGLHQRLCLRWGRRAMRAARQPALLPAQRQRHQRANHPRSTPTLPAFNDTPSGQQFEDVPVGSTYYTYTYRLVSRAIMAGYPCGGAGEPCATPATCPTSGPTTTPREGRHRKIVSGTFFPDCSSTNAAKP